MEVGGYVMLAIVAVLALGCINSSIKAHKNKQSANCLYSFWCLETHWALEHHTDVTRFYCHESDTKYLSCGAPGNFTTVSTASVRAVNEVLSPGSATTTSPSFHSRSNMRTRPEITTVYSVAILWKCAASVSPARNFFTATSTAWVRHSVGAKSPTNHPLVKLES